MMEQERKVLVGRTYTNLSTDWHEWNDDSFEDVCAAISKRREDGKVNTAPDEIIEVIVVRRAVVRGTIEVQEVSVRGEQEEDDGETARNG